MYLSTKQKRTVIGLMALLLLAIGGVLTISGVSGAAATEGKASSLRLAVICGLIWLAYPELLKLPGWLFPALICTALAAYRWRWLFALVPVITVVCWLLKPRRKDASNGQNHESEGRHFLRSSTRKMQRRRKTTNYTDDTNG